METQILPNVKKWNVITIPCPKINDGLDKPKTKLGLGE